MYILQVPVMLSGFDKKNLDLWIFCETSGYYTTGSTTSNSFVSNCLDHGILVKLTRRRYSHKCRSGKPWCDKLTSVGGFLGKEIFVSRQKRTKQKAHSQKYQLSSSLLNLRLKRFASKTHRRRRRQFRLAHVSGAVQGRVANGRQASIPTGKFHRIIIRVAS